MHITIIRIDDNNLFLALSSWIELGIMKQKESRV